jgi:hypothetical protein
MTRHSILPRAVVAALLLASAIGCHRDEPAPAAPFDAKRALTAYLGGVYGVDATRGTTWSEGRDDARVERGVCAFGPMPGEPRGRYLLAVCGTLPMGGHAEPGVVDFHLLEPAEAAFHPVAVARDEASGSDGAPGTVTLVRLGRERGGFIVAEGWTGQGYLLESLSVREFQEGTLQTLAQLRTHIDNLGASDCSGSDCGPGSFAVDFETGFDATHADADGYPLLVHEHGRECGADVELRHRLDFDATTRRYPVPDALMREDCRRNPAPEHAPQPPSAPGVPRP